MSNNEGSRVEATLTAVHERLALFMKSFLEASQQYHKLVDGIGLPVLPFVEGLKPFNDGAQNSRRTSDKNGYCMWSFRSSIFSQGSNRLFVLVARYSMVFY